MKYFKYYFILLLIILLGVFLRFYKLGKIPDGFYVDESSIGYNVYSILKTGRDEWGERFPIYFKSFGDYKLPVYFYLSIIPVAIFGLNEFSVRFISAFAGSLTILVVFFLAQKIAKKFFSKKEATLVGCLSALLLIFEPWHLHFSRIALETNLSLFLTLLGFYLLLDEHKVKSFRTVMGYLFLIGSFFTYLAPRLFIPTLSVFIFIFSKKREEKKKWLINLIIFFFLFLTSIFNIQTLNRIKGISIFHPFIKLGIEGAIIEKISEHNSVGNNFWLRAAHNKPIEYSIRIIAQYLNHFSPNFLFFEGDTFNKRFAIPFSGNFLLVELPFFLLGLYCFIRKKEYFLPLWFFLAPIPSAFSFQSPSSVRSIYMMPAFQIISATGLVLLFKLNFINNKLKNFFLIILPIIYIVNISYFLENYFVHQLVHEPYYWDYGFKELVLKVKKIESDYTKIVVGKEKATYAHFLFFGQMDPRQAQETIERTELDRFGFQPANKMGKYYFDPECPIDNNKKERVLYICRSTVDDDKYRIVDKINFKNGSLNLVLFERKYELQKK